MERVAVAGTGRMGLPICHALVRAGYPVVATDERAERAEPVLACGASWRDTPAEAGAIADTLVTVLPGPAQVQAVMLGADGALATLAAGTTWIDMTTSSPAAAAPIRSRALERGVQALEAPMGGGIQAAREGRLELFIGGDAGLLEEHRPLLEAIADPGRILHVGGHGTGYTVKLIVNLLWFGQAVATAEAMLLGQRAGVNAEVLRQALTASAAASNFIGCDVQAVFQGDYLRSFGLDGICQELADVTGLATEYGVPFEISRQVRRIYQRARARYGPVAGELLAVALLEEQAGTKLRPR
ncbi:MAG: NAD(P)-dependent oxidoreductase [Actinobacteria bacterium]|nr:NAD(P)-dependent oxidoreductase [Actinomycetota bacterium]MBO0785474.1 NAD(P)-dependent oxidoreductase [Actinomycetota bacterium]MBO0816458.1 NAD(P)-dependent oxidoreductase [Actinomycetota bacterium]